MNKPELLAPAGNLEKLKFAFLYGADAVYLGGPGYGLRAGAGNFSLEEIQEGVKIAHPQGKKVYVTLNVYATNEDLEGVESYLLKLKDLKVDGLIISDLGLFRAASAAVPQVPIHISTQANTTNYLAAQGWGEMGARRVVAAREVSLEGLKTIKERNPRLQLEAFVHGAMCLAYSGRCFLSAYLSGRSANQGECAHSCRWRYQLMEELRPGEYLPVEEDEKGSYIISPADLCMLEFIPQLVGAGIDSFKIEGRMKSLHHVATVVKVYRQAMDAYFNSHWEYIRRIPQWKEELGKAGSRPFNTGFYFGPPKMIPQEEAGEQKIRFVGVVQKYESGRKAALVEQRNRFSLGDTLEAVSPREDPFQWQLEQLTDLQGEARQAAPHPKEMVYVGVPRELPPGALLRRVSRE